MALRNLIINTQTGKETWRDNTAEEDTALLVRQQEAALQEAKEAQKEADKQLAMSEMSKTPEGQQILKAMGITPV